MAISSTHAVNGERRKVVKCLHDGLSQQFTAASLLSHMITELMGRENNSCMVEMTQLHNYLQNAVGDLNTLYKTLEPEFQQTTLSV